LRRLTIYDMVSLDESRKSTSKPIVSASSIIEGRIIASQRGQSSLTSFNSLSAFAWINDRPTNSSINQLITTLITITSTIA
jgi:hypothetical protein